MTRASRGVHKPCDHCAVARRCRMFIGRDGKPTYLCGVCAQELGYLGAPITETEYNRLSDAMTRADAAQRRATP